jgi:hypothetical protein
VPDKAMREELSRYGVGAPSIMTELYEYDPEKEEERNRAHDQLSGT